jgi:hypothetical protein
MARKTWHEIADVLALQMNNYVFCDNGHATIPSGLAEGCPNCEDSEAMRIYWENGGTVGKSPYALDEKTIAVHELNESNTRRIDG